MDRVWPHNGAPPKTKRSSSPAGSTCSQCRLPSVEGRPVIGRLWELVMGEQTSCQGRVTRWVHLCACDGAPVTADICTFDPARLRQVATCSSHQMLKPRPKAKIIAIKRRIAIATAAHSGKPRPVGFGCSIGAIIGGSLFARGMRLSEEPKVSRGLRFGSKAEPRTKRCPLCV